MDTEETARQVTPEMEETAARRAKDRAGAARWDLDVAVFFFAILSIIIILLSEGIGIEVTAPVAALGLALGWLMGWKKEKQVYDRFYDEELFILEQELKKTVEGTIEETVEEKVQRALRERWR